MEREPLSQRARNPALALARGTLRDGLGALGNLALLAGSSKVGSKAIAGVLPDVLASTGPMREAVRDLTGALRSFLGGNPIDAELEEFMQRRLTELESTLAELVGEPLRTAERLGLDRVLARLSRELDASQSLIDLLEVAAHEPSFALDVPEVLKQRLPATPSGRRPHRRFKTQLVVAPNLADAALKPRAFAALVGALAEMADEQGSCTIAVAARGAELEITISNAGLAGGEELLVWGYGLVAPSRAAVEAAAGIAGVALEVGDAGARLRLPV